MGLDQIDTTLQVSDDPELLKLMLDDMEVADPLYKPTNFWAVSNDLLIREIEQAGLLDFRSRKKNRLGGFGATDCKSNLISLDLKKLRYVNNRLIRRLPGWSGFLERISNYLANAINRRCDFQDDDIYRMCWQFCHELGTKSTFAKPLSGLSESRMGNPEEYFSTPEGNIYTIRFLTYYLRYAFVSKNLDFDNVRTFVELGSGAGRQIEILKKLHPNTTYLLFDIAPQIYIAERYLDSVFPGEVVSYRQTRSLKDLENLEKGKIYVFGSWQFPLLKGTEIDVFWNAASMQEMEPDVVGNYLSIVDQCAINVFIEAVMHGHHIARRPGEPGVLKKTTIDDYQNGLSRFRMVDSAPTITCFGSATISTSGTSTESGSTDTWWSRQP